jgi:cytochrome b
MSAAAPAVLVWPWWQRALHWLLAACVITATVTYEGGRLHEAAGYAALAAALARIALGLFGPAESRFSAFVRGHAATWQYSKALWNKQESRHINHNPLGAWMTLALLSLAALGALSGWLYTTDRYWGEAWVINLHAALCWLFVVLVPLHLAGVVHAGRRHGENLVAAMLNGRKRPDDR